MKNIFALLLTVFIISPCIYPCYAFQKGERAIDSLKNILAQRTEKDTVHLKVLIQVANKTRGVDIRKSMDYLDEAIQLSRTLEAPRYEVEALKLMGVCYGMQDQYPEAIASFNKAVDLALQKGYLPYAADSYTCMGIVHKRMGDYPTSLSYYSKAMDIADSLHNEQSQASASTNIGLLYATLGELDKAMDYFKRALTLAEKLKDGEHVADIYMNLAFVHDQKNEIAQAIEGYKKGYAYYTTHNLQEGKVLSLTNIGASYYKLGDYTNAESFLLQALPEAEKHSLLYNKIGILTYLARVNEAQKKFKKSEQYAREAYAIANELNSINTKSNTTALLASVYESAGDKTNALKYYKQHLAFKDSIFNEDKAKAYKSSQVKMEVQQKNQQLEEQTLRLAFLDQQVTLENRWRWMLSAASVLLLVAVALYYQKFQQRKAYASDLENKNQLISQQHTAIENANLKLEKQMALRMETDAAINYFASSLIGKNNTDDVLRDIAGNCASQLGLEHCSIYMLDDAKNTLVPKATYQKATTGFPSQTPLKIEDGIVSIIIRTGAPEMINDLSVDNPYSIETASKSILAVPLLNHRKVIGIIVSEHPDKNFFSQFHLDALKTIAAIGSSKIAQIKADEEGNKAKIAQIEAEQIKEVDKMKSQFFANISHEFRTPLNLILGPLQLYDRDIPDDYLNMMKRNAQRLLTLVNQLLDLAKLEVGKIRLNYKNIDVYAFLRIQIASFSALAESKQINYNQNIPDDKALMKADPDKIEKICFNLLSNAIKFTPPGGTVSIEAVIESSDLLRLSVSDTGIGIPVSEQTKIFKRFYQVDNSQTRRYEGSGVGLALTKELVELQGGTISVSSEEGKGSIFIVYIPLQPADGTADTDIYASPAIAIPETNRLPIPTSELPDDKPVVLIAEDNPDLRSYISDNLRSMFTILEASDGEEGLLLASEKIPDIIITDVMMPRMDGVEFTHQIKNNTLTSHIPVVMLTARDDAHTKKSGFRTGADQYVTKPFDLAELQIRIEGLIKQRNRLREKFSQEIVLKPQAITVDTHDARFMQAALQVVEENLSNTEFTVEDMQRELGMSRMQLHRKLKALTDQSASEFVRDIRLQRAAQLLEDPGKQVAEVAYEVGFNHLSYFAKCFKEKYSVAPSSN
jgi:signal transduction histidine kinase/DNA-binding response OmpR family regulator